MTPTDEEASTATAPLAPAPRVGVVTVTYNSASVLPEFLQSMRANSRPGVMVFAIDNVSTDNTVELLQASGLSALTIVRNPVNVGLAAGNNQGIQRALAAGCEYVLLLNNDVRFGPDLVDRLLEGARHENASLVAPKIYEYDRPDHLWCAGGKFLPWRANESRHRGEGQRDCGQFDRAVFVDFAPACCWLMHRKVLEQVGIIDENFFVYFDDTDYCYRAKRRHLRVLVWPEARLWHKQGSLTGGLTPFTIHHIVRGRVYYIRKHQARWLAPLWLGLYQARLWLRRLLGLESREGFRLKQGAFAEGMQLPLPGARTAMVGDGRPGCGATLEGKQDGQQHF